MNLKKKITSGVLLSAGVLALAGCSTGTIEDAVANYDSIDSGTLTMEYKVDSDTYGEYSIDLEGQFEKVADEGGNEQAKADTGLVQTVNASELEDSAEVDEAEGAEVISEGAKEESEESKESEASADVEEGARAEGTEEEESKEDPSRGYNYQMVEENRVYIDGQETKSTGEIIALDDTLYDKVFLTGSEADGRFVYDSRDVGIMEYPVADFVNVSPIIDSFDFEGSDIEVESGNLHNGEKGHVFTVTPEQVVTSLQENGENALVKNILGIVTEANVDSVVIGVNDNSFTVEAISTGDSGSTDTTSSEAETAEGVDTKEEDKVVGSLVLTKTKGDVEITEPSNAMDLDEFSSLIELFYQQQSEQQIESEVSEEEVYGEEVELEDVEDMEGLEEEVEQQDSAEQSQEESEEDAE